VSVPNGQLIAQMRIAVKGASPGKTGDQKDRANQHVETMKPCGHKKN